MIRVLRFALLLCSTTPSLHAEESNLGAVPAHVAISSARAEANDQFLGGQDLDAKIRPYHGGWCVTLRAAMLQGGIKLIPVFVEQSGRAWRTDQAAAKKYDGGTDGRYMPPWWAKGCKAAK